MPAASATDEPPYFWTTIPTTDKSRRAGGAPPGVRRLRGHLGGVRLLLVEHLVGAAISSASPVNSLSSRSCATTESSALRATPARLPHEET
jgi:hypothetical protein